MKQLEFHEQIFCDEYLTNGNNMLNAFEKAYPEIVKSYDSSNDDKLQRKIIKYLKQPNIQLYLINTGGKILGAYDVTRNYLLSKHLRVIEIYEQMLELLEEDELTV